MGATAMVRPAVQRTATMVKRRRGWSLVMGGDGRGPSMSVTACFGSRLSLLGARCSATGAAIGAGCGPYGGCQPPLRVDNCLCF